VTSIDTEHFRQRCSRRSSGSSTRSRRSATSTSGSLDDEVDEVAATSDNHVAETASATLGREIDYTLGDNAEQVLSEIDAALGRIDDRTYGICFNCGNEIPRERLEANPGLLSASTASEEPREGERASAPTGGARSARQRTP
jgi:RNA polymerase-binding transcription factor DksA